MLITVAIILYTQNLAIGVVVGVILSALLFVGNISRVTVIRDKTTYKVKGPLFFASTTTFMKAFDQIDQPAIIIDFSNSQLWDESAVAAIVKVQEQLEKKNIKVTITGLNESSEKLYDQLN